MSNVLDFLEELASIDTLYHTLDPSLALSVLQSGVFRLPFSETNKSESLIRGPYDEETGKHKVIKRHMPGLFYLSTARTLNSSYIADRGAGLRGVNYAATFVIDVPKLIRLNRGVKIKPIDYWGTNNVGRVIGGGAKEAEERIFSDNHKLNIKGCLKVLLVVDRDASWYSRQLYTYCLTKHIPVKLFTTDNLSGFRLQKPTKEDTKVAIEILKKVKRTHGYQTSFNGVSPISSKTATKFWNKKSKNNERVSEYDALKMLVNTDDYEKLPYPVRSRYLGRSYDGEGLHQRFDNYFHNLRSTVSRGNNETERVGDLVKKSGATSLSEFFIKLDRKWERLEKEFNDREHAKWVASREAQGQSTKSVWDN